MMYRAALILLYLFCLCRFCPAQWGPSQGNSNSGPQQQDRQWNSLRQDQQMSNIPQERQSWNIQPQQDRQWNSLHQDQQMSNIPQERQSWNIQPQQDRQWNSLHQDQQIWNIPQQQDRQWNSLQQDQQMVTFADCLSGSQISVTPVTLENMFATEMQRLSNNLQNDGTLENTVAKAALRVSSNLLSRASCDLNRTDSRTSNQFLHQFKVPEKWCPFARPNCAGLANSRQVSGICNNLDRPLDGASETAFARILDPVYDNGFNTPRSRSVVGDLLPSPRECSLQLFQNKQRFARSYTNYWVMNGQFIGHDLSLASPASDDNGKIVSCSCNRNEDTCVNIKTPQGDPWMSDQKCMTIPATAEALSDPTCSLGIRGLMNGNTHFLDLSMIYGSKKETTENFREHRDGLMKITRVAPFQDYLPIMESGRSCVDANDRIKCFQAGDPRVMENLLLTGITTQWWRFHNHLARQLKQLHNDWSDERLFEEAKKINVAYFQHTVFDEYLRVMLGKDIHAKYFSGPSQYDPRKSPAIWTEFATAAFRCHTFVRDWYSRATPDYKLIDQKLLWDISHHVAPAWEFDNGGLDAITRGAVFDYGSAFDSSFADQIRHHLFETVENAQAETKRFDLPAMNMNRARESGIDGYNAYREWCGFKRAKIFEHFSDMMNSDSIEDLKRVYRHPDDVDLWAGLNMENPISGGLVGPTSACIIAQQFLKVKQADRFFYEHPDVLTPEQLQIIKSFPFQCFMCVTLETRSMQPNAFLPPSQAGNGHVPCDQCSPINLRAW
ncbi:unnamed protein product [Didymodactylos carnosus]|uniref:Peroxidase n=1 Tax=Didymodactylos carnosus TaxID=1234261 RepID=A0A813RT59_9BILA|nr:unnamed protein product [Didymodactylos carnosus]CAF3570225.1 unnamed protein product [Didymodactylos carnosus]